MPKEITYFERKSCLGKTKHGSLLGATNHLMELRKFSKTPESLNWYKCTFCDYYHVGNHIKNLTE